MGLIQQNLFADYPYVIKDKKRQITPADYVFNFICILVEIKGFDTTYPAE